PAPLRGQLPLLPGSGGVGGGVEPGAPRPRGRRAPLPRLPGGRRRDARVGGAVAAGPALPRRARRRAGGRPRARADRSGGRIPMTLSVAPFDYGAGRLPSRAKALELGGAAVTVTSDWDVALGRDALVLPGVGGFGAAARALPEDRARLRDALAGGLPCLGICLGMQLLFDASDEGEGEGIGFVPGRVRRLEAPVVPHTGWNDVEATPDPLFAGLGGGLPAYYAHSFRCDPEDAGAVIG